MSSLFILSLLIIISLIAELGPLSFLVLLTLAFVFLCISSLSFVRPSSLVTFLVSLLLIIVGIFVATHSMFLFFIMYECSLVPICLLILLLGYQPEKLSAMLFLLLYTVLCSAPFLYFTVTLSTSLRLGFSMLSPYSCVLVCLSFLVKSPIYTLHIWLPKAHVEASLVGSMLLAGVILKLGRYGLIMLSPYLTSSASLFVYLTLSGRVVCSCICFRCWDMKSLVAYSSVVHMGLITLGRLSGLELGNSVARGMLVCHSLLSPLIFLLAYELYLTSASRSFYSCFARSLSSCVLFLIGLISGLNFGLPPFLGFWVEVSTFKMQSSLWALSLCPLLVSSFFSFLYSVLFYVLSVGGPVSVCLPRVVVLFPLIPGPIFLLGLPLACCCLSTV